MDNLKRHTNKISFKEKRKLTETAYEITKHNMNVIERYPLHCGNTVLQLSKLILMEFMLFLYDYLEPWSWEIIYSGNILIILLKKLIFNLDTDSVCLCTTGELDDLVRSSKREMWPEMKARWFVAPPTGDARVDALDARFPGKMKLEWKSDTGKIIA